TSAALAVDGRQQLPLVHPRAPPDVELLRVVVELLARPAASAAAGALTSAPARRDVAGRGPRALPRLARPRALLLHGARRDLLRAALRAALLPLASLHVLVLPGSLRALSHTTRWHSSPSSFWLAARLPGGLRRKRPRGRGQTRGQASSSFRTLPVALRGSESRNSTSRGTL